MKKVAIVGTSIDLLDGEERDVRQFIAMILKNRYSPSDTIVISGGAKGVDSLAIEVAQGLGFKTKIYHPKLQRWNFYKKRNLQIAKECDELHCLSIPVRKVRCFHHEEPQEHEKTAGCWTMNKALELDKPCQLIVTSNR